MKRTVDLSLVLPCYNEASIFQSSVEQIVRVMELSRLTYEIIFVDDASGDGTQHLIRRACKTSRRMRCIFHPENQGRGRTVTDGILAGHGSVVGYIDIDCEVSPVYIPLMVQTILEGDSDFSLGRRMYRTTVDSLLREVFSVGYRWIVEAAFHTGGLDTESGYKFFLRKKILPLLPLAKHPHWFWDTEITVFCRLYGLRIREIPVLYLRRFDKQSSVRVIRDIVDYIRSIREFRYRLAHGSPGPL